MRKNLIYLLIFTVVLSGIMYFVCKFARGDGNDPERDAQYKKIVEMAETWKSNYGVSMKEIKSIKDSLLIVKSQRDILVVTANRWRDSADILSQVVDTITKPEVADSTNPKWQRLYVLTSAENVKRKEENIVLRNIIIKDSVQISFMEKENKALEGVVSSADTVITGLRKTLDDERKRRVCKIILWECPSRKKSAVIGAVATVVGISYIRK